MYCFTLTNDLSNSVLISFSLSHSFESYSFFHSFSHSFFHSFSHSFTLLFSLSLITCAPFSSSISLSALSKFSLCPINCKKRDFMTPSLLYLLLFCSSSFAQFFFCDESSTNTSFQAQGRRSVSSCRCKFRCTSTLVPLSSLSRYTYYLFVVLQQAALKKYRNH